MAKKKNTHYMKNNNALPKAEPERGVVGGRVETHSRAGRRRREEDLAPADLIARQEREAVAADERAPATRRRPRSDAGAFDVAHVAERGIDLGPRRRSGRLPLRCGIAQVAQIERRLAADDQPSTRGHELQQGRGIVDGQVARLEYEHGRVGRWLLVRDRSALAFDAVVVVREQRAVGREPVGRGRVRGAGCAAGLVAADRAVEALRQEVDDDEATDHDRDRDPAAANGRGGAIRAGVGAGYVGGRHFAAGAHRRPASSSTFGHSRRAASTSGGSADRPP